MKHVTESIPVLGRLARSLRIRVAYLRGSHRLKKLRGTSPLRLVIGAQGVHNSSWTNTDIEYLDLLNPNHWEMYFDKGSVDAMLAEHVWEHLTERDALEAAQRCFEYLRPGGYLRVAVPDGYHPSQDYITWVEPGGRGPGATEHKVLYDHMSLTAVFETAGFRVELLEYFDSEGQFHFRDWDPQDGTIHRSSRFDARNADGSLSYTSLILDAHKDVPLAPAVDSC